jgi:hypothetical protein
MTAPHHNSLSKSTNGREVIDMPNAWTAKDDRQYEHIRKQLRQKGKSAAKAKEIAARTVNKQRRIEGRTPNKRTQGTGHPYRRLEERTREELYNRAKQLNIVGRSAMNKADLIAAIRKKR